MIDLDNAQDQGGWDARLKVGGAVIMLAHPSTQSATSAVRSGLLPCVWRGAVRCWRLLAGSTQVEDLRREVLSCVMRGDAEGRHAVMTMGAWDLARVYAAYQEAARGLLVESTARAVGGERARERARERAGADDAAMKAASTGVESGGKHALRRGERLPWFMGGRAWGAEVRGAEVRGVDHTHKETGNG